MFSICRTLFAFHLNVFLSLIPRFCMFSFRPPAVWFHNKTSSFSHPLSLCSTLLFVLPLHHFSPCGRDKTCYSAVMWLCVLGPSMSVRSGVSADVTLPEGDVSGLSQLTLACDPHRVYCYLPSFSGRLSSACRNI